MKIWKKLLVDVFYEHSVHFICTLKIRRNQSHYSSFITRKGY